MTIMNAAEEGFLAPSVSGHSVSNVLRDVTGAVYYGKTVQVENLPLIRLSV